MTINAIHKDFVTFVENELDTLSYFMNQPSINAIIPALSSMGNKVLSKYSYSKNKQVIAKNRFEFNCMSEFKIQKATKNVIISGFINPDFTDLSYQIVIFHPDNTINNETGKKFLNEEKLIRKFHFDYVKDGGNQSPKKPVYHLQHGGSQSQHMADYGVGAGPHKWIEVPRFHYQPVNLAIMVDMLLNEFPTDDTQKIREDSYWRSLIKKNEDFLLKPYYDCINSFIENQHTSSFLLRDFYYGK